MQLQQAGDQPCTTSSAASPSPASPSPSSSSGSPSASGPSASKPSATVPSDGLTGPLTDPRLPRHYTRSQTIDYAIRTIGKGARLGHQIKNRLQRIKLVGPGRETAPRENDPPVVQLLIALANAAEECLTAEAGERGTDLDRIKAKMAGLQATAAALNNAYQQVGAMAQAHIRLAAEAKKLEQVNRHHEEEMELKRKALLMKPSRAGLEAADILDSALQSMDNAQLDRYRTGSIDVTPEP
jgi:hypothetical protein